MDSTIDRTPRHDMQPADGMLSLQPAHIVARFWATVEDVGFLFDLRAMARIKVVARTDDSADR